MTEHVPSTGRPSSRGQNSPRTVLKPPPLLSEAPAPVMSGYLCVINFLSAFCFSSHTSETHTLVRFSFHDSLLFYPPPLPAVGRHHLATLLQKTPAEGRRDVRGQWFALWTLTGHASLISPQWRFCSLAYKSPARCKKFFFLLILSTFPFQTEEFLFDVQLMSCLLPLTRIILYRTEG